MSEWPVVTLGDVFEIARGGSPRPIEEYITDDPDGINWIMIGDAPEGAKYIERTKKRIRPEGAKRSRVVGPGDFLLSNSMSFGRPYIMKTSGCVHDGWLVLSPRRRDVDPDFLFRLLGSAPAYAEFERRAAGATVKNLNIDVVAGVQIPLPTLAEQRRIADILDRADAMRAKRREAIGLLEALPQAVFVDMFGAPNQLAKAKTVALSDVLTGVDSGWSPTCLDRPAELDEWGVLKLGAVTWGEFDSNENKAMRSETTPDPSIEVQVGDLLMVRKNTYELVGNCCVVGPTRRRLMMSDLIFRLKIATGASVDVTYLSWTLRQSAVRRRLRSLAGGTAGSMPNISKGRLLTLRVPLAPFELQREFARRVAAIDTVKAAHRASLAEMDALFASLQHRAFRGEL